MGRFQEIVVEINTKQDVPRVRKMLVLMWYSLQSRYRRAGHRAYGPLYNHGGERLPGTAAHWKQLRCANEPLNQKSIDSHYRFSDGNAFSAVFLEGSQSPKIARKACGASVLRAANRSSATKQLVTGGNAHNRFK